MTDAVPAEQAAARLYRDVVGLLGSNLETVKVARDPGGSFRLVVFVTGESGVNPRSILPDEFLGYPVDMRRGVKSERWPAVEAPWVVEPQAGLHDEPCDPHIWVNRAGIVFCSECGDTKPTGPPVPPGITHLSIDPPESYCRHIWVPTAAGVLCDTCGRSQPRDF